MSFLPCQANQSPKSQSLGKLQAVKPAQKNVVQKRPVPDKAKGLHLLKETLQTSLVQKKPAPPTKLRTSQKSILPSSKRLM